MFFDFNIPYLGGSTSDKSVPDRAGRRATLLKLCTKAMELGYSGVAYTRSIRGVMSDSDTCSISLFSLSSLLKVAPYIVSSVKFHRKVLGIPEDFRFRQYTRLNLAIETSAHATVLNSGNPVLKTYDLVSVQPLSQGAFDHVCQFAEVDIISIDFSAKVPFRMKLPMIKVAIERGVYFEIGYSGLIIDVQTRRQVIGNAKLLASWTRGKNLIISSMASNIDELRGPYDVANLCSLFGLSMERAKAAVSKNCRSLIMRAMRKKQFYKEAIKVEAIPVSEQESAEVLINSWLKWDPISSGDGDLQLDDMAKFFSASSKDGKTIKSKDLNLMSDKKIPLGLKVEADDDRNIMFASSSKDGTAGRDQIHAQHSNLMRPPSHSCKVAANARMDTVEVDEMNTAYAMDTVATEMVNASERDCEPVDVIQSVSTCKERVRDRGLQLRKKSHAIIKKGVKRRMARGPPFSSPFKDFWKPALSFKRTRR